MCVRVVFYIYIYTYIADLSIIHCLNVVRCIIVYLKYIIIIMKFQKKSKKLVKDAAYRQVFTIEH